MGPLFLNTGDGEPKKEIIIDHRQNPVQWIMKRTRQCRLFFVKTNIYMNTWGYVCPSYNSVTIITAAEVSSLLRILLHTLLHPTQTR